MSRMLGGRDGFTIQLRDPDSGEALDDHDALSAIMQDLLNRPSHAQALDTVFRDHISETVGHIRRHRATWDPEEQCAVEPEDDHLFSMEELESVLEALDKTKLAFKGSYAAVKADVAGGKHLSLAIVNMSLAWGVSATSGSQRQCNPLRKSGPVVVTQIKCLRPVCQSSELAAITDGLIILRHGERLQIYWGADQYGGRYDAQAPILVVVLLSELRAAAGLDLIINFKDQIHGYDVVPKDDIRLGLFRARVRGRFWMLLDDQLRTDQVRLNLHYLSSTWEHPKAGIGQGRRSSSHLFNTAARQFRDELNTYSPGVGVPSSSMQRDILDIAASINPPSDQVLHANDAAGILPAMRSFIHDPLSSAMILSTLPSHACRMLALDLISITKIQCVQYSDDNATPSSSWPP